MEKMRMERGDGDGRWRAEKDMEGGAEDDAEDAEAGEQCPAEEVLWGRTPRTGRQPLGVLRGSHTGVTGPKNLGVLENPSRTWQVSPSPPWGRRGCLELRRGRGDVVTIPWLRWEGGCLHLEGGLHPWWIMPGVILLAFPCFGKGENPLGLQCQTCWTGPGSP